MNTASIKMLPFVGALCLLLIVQVSWPCAQTEGQSDLAVVRGTVHDSENHALAGAAVYLESAGAARSLSTITDSQGRFQFEPVPPGNYTVRTTLTGYRETKDGPFLLRAQEKKSVVLLLTKAQAAAAFTKDAASAFEFSDEPQFTVSGVTDTTALGGHGSNRVQRNAEALSKDAASLVRGGSDQPGKAPHTAEDSVPPTEASLRASLAKQETADARFELAEIEEREGHPLEAVRDYERAAQMQPTEPHLFAWGAELLLHRAFAPAVDVFSKGRGLYPQSVRMELGLGAAMYAQGSKEEAWKFLLEASDLDPADPVPYLFLGRLQATETDLPPALTDRMKRFVNRHPENATAHCLYAAALAKQGRQQENFHAIESQLRTAIQLDPRLGSAYLQLGILLSGNKDYPAAIAALQKAIETTPLPDEAHYYLAAVYRRTGEMEKAKKETELFKEVSAQKDKDAERDRREIQQFVYTLRNHSTPSQTPSSNPR